MHPRTVLWVVVLIFGICLSSALAQPISSPYKFPTRVGMPGWKSLNTLAEKLAACQIPQDTLQRLSTEALVQTCLDYPMFLLYSAYTDSLGGMARVISGFNGMQELLRRKDAGSFLVKKYLEYDPLAHDENWSDDKMGEFSLKLDGLERLLGHDSILTSLQADERRNLLSLAVDRFKKKVQDRNYGLFDAGSSAWLAGRVMIHEHFDELIAALKADDRLSDAMARCMLPGKEEIDEIVRHADNFLKIKP